jgi:hypothetical protein
MTNNVFMTMTETSHKDQWRLAGQTPLQMRTITYNDEAAPWSRSNHLMGTGWLPSSDDTFVESLWELLN